MDKALLLHWWGWNSDENWLPWLQKELNLRLLDVYTPNLPSTNMPVIEEQEEYIDIYASELKNWGFIVWHSLGSQLAMNFIEENYIKNSTVILVAPSYPEMASELWKEVFWDSYDFLEKYSKNEINFKKINKLNNKIVVFLSNNDPFINMESAKKYYWNIKNIEFKEFKNKGHFNEWYWILELKEILDYLN